MAVLTESAEEHVLETFARHDATTLSASLLFDESAPFSRNDIAQAVSQLEHGGHALLCYTWNGSDWITLTLRGLARRGGTASAPSGPQIVYEHPHLLGHGATQYHAYILGAERSDGTWSGWIEFVPTDGSSRLRTAQETSQPNRDALAYWASGLEDVYFDGALARATA